MDHFALPDDELALAQERGSLHRNFMGYTTHADTDLIGLGVSAISHIGDSYSQNPRDLPLWEAAIDAGRLPVWRGMRLSADDVLRADLIQQLMCQGEVDIAAFEQRHDDRLRRLFRRRDCAAAAAGGRRPGDASSQAASRATSRGRLLLRIIAMCFDRYLQPAAGALHQRRASRARSEPRACAMSAAGARRDRRTRRSPTTATTCISAAPARSPQACLSRGLSTRPR